MSPELLRLMFFIAMKLLLPHSLKWLWRKVCHSSLKYEDEVLSFQLAEAQNKIKFVTDWLIDTSPTPYKTLFLHSLHSLISGLPFVGAAFAVFALFPQVTFLDKFLNILGAITAGLFVVSLIIGILYKFFGEEKDLEKIKNRGITKYDSYVMATAMGNRKKGFVFRVSRVPSYIFICLWLSCFLFMLYMFVTGKTVPVITFGDDANEEETYAVTDKYEKEISAGAERELWSLEKLHFQKAIKVFEENGFLAFGGEADDYENTIQISSMTATDVIFIFGFEEESAALNWFEAQTESFGENEKIIEKTHDKKDEICRYIIETYYNFSDGTEEISTSVRKIICTGKFVIKIDCEIEHEKNIYTLLEKSGIPIK
ncbi:MAG: hypothetical protein IKK85_08320 [Clostridia bacterium]|nr:hypothetical protein [Clostridia bacterium]